MTRAGPAPLSVKGVCLDAGGRELVTAYPFEVLEGRWVNIVAYGCEPRVARPLQTSGEHAQVAFKHLGELSRREFPDGYRDAARLWQERRAMSHN